MAEVSGNLGSILVLSFFMYLLNGTMLKSVRHSQLLKVGAVLFLGFFFTLLTTAWTVVGVRMMLPSDDGEDSPSVENPTSEISDQSSSSPKPFSQALNNKLRVWTVASGVAAVLATHVGSAFSTPLTSVFMLGVTLTSFLFGARLPKPVVKVVHPLVTCTALTWAVAFAFAKLIGSSFLSVVKSYRTKTLQLFSVGAGDVSYSSNVPSTQRGHLTHQQNFMV